MKGDKVRGTPWKGSPHRWEKQGNAMTERRPNPSCVLKVGDGRGFVISHRVRVQKSRSSSFGCGST